VKGVFMMRKSEMRIVVLLVGWVLAGAGLCEAQNAGAMPARKSNETEVPDVSFTGSFEVGGGSTARAGGKATFSVKGSVVTVETDDYAVDMTDMVISRVKDKRTGQEYCRRDASSARGQAALFLKDYRPGQPERTFYHVARDEDAPPPGVVRKWLPLVPVEFTSSAGASGAIADDGAVSVSGVLGKGDKYTLKAVVPAGIEARGFMLEALSDPGLPAHGPGRAFNGNFAVSRFSVNYGTGTAHTPTAVTFSGAKADYEQEGTEAAGTIDNDPGTVWAVGGEAGKNHSATFMIQPGAKVPAGASLEIVIEQNSRWADHTLGKFRLSVMHEILPAEGVQSAEPPRVHIKRLPHGVEYTVRGLECPGEAEARIYYEEAMLGMRMEYDDKTGDLVLTPLGGAGRPAQFGVHDEGVWGVSFTVGPFARDVQLIPPLGMPRSVDGAGGWWPIDWPVCLMLFQASGGECLSIWANDRRLEYGKRFWGHDGMMDFHTVSGDAPWRTGSLEAPIWRLNVFESWEPAALRYREMMEKTLDLIPTEECEPEWVRKIRLVSHQVFGVGNYGKYYIDRGVPKEAIMEWDTQAWLNGYGTEIMSAKRPEWIPNYPFDNPTHYEGYPGYAGSVKARQDFGVPCFPYTCMFTTLAEPFRKSSTVLRGPDMDFSGGGRMWWVLYANMMEDLVNRYGVRGLYDDCSWIGPRYDPRGKVDGLTVWQAHALGRRYLRDRLLPVPFMGERQHELTIISDRLALMWVGGEVHPINHYIFGPYSLRWNQAEEIQQGNWVARGLANTFEVHNSLDASESLSCIMMNSTGRLLGNAERQEMALIRKRLFFWGQEMLTPYFPKKYEPGVIVYLRGKDGTEYRTRNAGGMGLTRVVAGEERIVWWRTRGVSSFDCPGAAIEGWVAYNDDEIIGMNPGVRYVALEDIERPPVTISKMPAGVTVSASRVEDGYWTASVAGGDGPVEMTVSSGGKTLRFVGAEVLGKPGAGGEYRVRVRANGMFAACWGREPQKVVTLPARLDVPSSRLEFMGQAGVPVYSQNPPVVAGGAQTVLTWDAWLPQHVRQADYLVALPRSPAAMQFKVSGAAGTVRLRVNGDVGAEVRHGGGGSTPLEVSLAAFAGQTVLITLDISAEGKVSVESPVLVSAN
jgi:hypothetical protein